MLYRFTGADTTERIAAGRRAVTAALPPGAVAGASVIETAAGTGRYCGAGTTRAAVSGVAGTIDVVAFTNDASWGGCTMVAGRRIGPARRGGGPDALPGTHRYARRRLDHGAARMGPSLDG